MWHIVLEDCQLQSFWTIFKYPYHHPFQNIIYNAIIKNSMYKQFNIQNYYCEGTSLVSACECFVTCWQQLDHEYLLSIPYYHLKHSLIFPSYQTLFILENVLYLETTSVICMFAKSPNVLSGYVCNDIHVLDWLRLCLVQLFLLFLHFQKYICWYWCTVMNILVEATYYGMTRKEITSHM